MFFYLTCVVLKLWVCVPVLLWFADCGVLALRGLFGHVGYVVFVLSYSQLLLFRATFCVCCGMCIIIVILVL